MKKKKLILSIYIPVFLLGILFVYLMNIEQNKKRKIAPRIEFDIALDSLNVKSISFERSDLYLNGVLYNAGGISSHSRVSSLNNRIVRLRDIDPPFKMFKKVKNDTLEIITNRTKYYLLVTEEIKYSRTK